MRYNTKNWIIEKVRECELDAIPGKGMEILNGVQFPKDEWPKEYSFLFPGGIIGSGIPDLSTDFETSFLKRIKLPWSNGFLLESVTNKGGTIDYYDNRNARLEKIDLENGMKRLSIGPTTWQESKRTLGRMLNDQKYSKRLLEIGEKEFANPRATIANNIVVIANIIPADEKFILFKRSEKVQTYPGFLSHIAGRLSGKFLYQFETEGISKTATFLNAAKQQVYGEVQEELSVTPVEICLTHVIQEFETLLKFDAIVSETSSELAAKIKTSESSWEHDEIIILSNKAELARIVRNECLSRSCYAVSMINLE